MNKVVSIFRTLLNKQEAGSPLPPVPETPQDSIWNDILTPNLTGLKIETPIGRVTLHLCTEPTITPEGSIYSPRTPFCGINGIKVPVTVGKPYRVISTYLGKGRRKSQIHFFQFQCDDGSIHLVNPSDCEFLGCELKAAG
jgi:hypothetical protein